MGVADPVMPVAPANTAPLAPTTKIVFSDDPVAPEIAVYDSLSLKWTVPLSVELSTSVVNA
jgi:hypothetical protein